MDYKLSIIIPVFNAGADLTTCIDSVLAQTIKDFEVILVDDGSTDGSGEMCDKYVSADYRIKVIHQQNGGQAHARNVGINNAKGEYIGFVDNDDTVEPEMFKVLLNNALSDSFDISSVSFKELKENGKIEDRQHYSIISEFSNKEGVKEILSRKKLDIYVWTKIYKRHFLLSHNILFEEGQNDEDILFNFAAYTKASSSILVDIPLYVYHYKSGSEARRIRIERINSYLSGTWYRVNKIVDETKNLYPEYLFLAERQKMLYCFQMLDAIIRSDLGHKNLYYKNVMAFYHNNKMITIKNKDIVGLKTLGIICLLFLPRKLYYYYKKYKIKFDDKI
jgi:glycosyltransferase involved in cell wall biosynthesis